MKNKDFDKVTDLFDFLQSNEFNFSFDKNNFYNNIVSKNTTNVKRKAKKKNNKIYKKSQKSSEKSSKETYLSVKNAENMSAEDEKFIKKSEKRDKKNQRIIEKCNDQIIFEDLTEEEKDVYLTIDKFNTNGKKTVVYFIDSFFPVIDGVVSVLDNYAVQMQKYYNVVICAPKHNQKRLKTDKYFVLQSDALSVKKQGYDLGFPQMDPEFQRYISHLKIDIIHIQSPFNMGSFGQALAKKRKVPCITTFHSQFKQNFYNAVKNEVIASWLSKIIIGLYQRSTVTVTMNNFAKNIMKEYGLNKSVKIIPNATNLVKKEFDRELEEKIITKHGIDKSKFNLIYIGRFVEVKNVYFMLEVAKELYKINKDFNFIFLGYGPEQSKMQKYIRENHMENIIKFTGKIDDVDEKSIIIKNSDLLFFPSVYDTDGIVKIECACYDVPTLCIEGTGVASNMTDNHNGFIEKNDKNSFVKRLNYLIKNVDLVKNIGKNANLELYITWEQVCEMLKDLYEETLKTYKFKNAKKNKNKTAQKIDAYC